MIKRHIESLAASCRLRDMTTEKTCPLMSWHLDYGYVGAAGRPTRWAGQPSETNSLTRSILEVHSVDAPSVTWQILERRQIAARSMRDLIGKHRDIL
jgi:hypothetical protein